MKISNTNAEDTAEYIKQLESKISLYSERLKKSIDIVDDYAYAVGKWYDPDIDYEEFYSWREELKGEEE
jgi:hypothetical protein